MPEPHSERPIRRCHVGKLPEPGVSWTFLSEAECDHLIGKGESALDGGASEKTPGLGLHNIPLYVYTTFSLSIHLSVDIWVASTSWLP